MADSGSYKLDPVFESIVTQLAMDSQKFWGRIGKSIDPDGLEDPACKAVLEACRAISTEGELPSIAAVRQRIRRWHRVDGRYSIDDYQSIVDFLDGATEDRGLHDSSCDSVIRELAYILRRRMEKEAVLTAIDVSSKKGDFSQVVKLLEGAKRIGVADTSLGMPLTAGVIDSIRSRASTVRIPTGIQELDNILQGGAKRGSFCVVSAATNVGKSMMLGHIAAHAITLGMNVAIATLELSEEDQHNRIISNLTDIPSDDIEREKKDAELAEERLSALIEDENREFGFCTCKYFSPRTTTIPHIIEWVDAEEQTYNLKFDILIIDYIALVGHTDPKTVRWSALTQVCEAARDFGETRGCLVWTANQANAEGMNTKKTKRLDNHHAADSKGVPKTADLHITLNPDDDGELLVFYVAKNRHGPKNTETDALPTEFERGRCAPVVRENWPY